jgi:uncharacterized membrane protein YfcA
MASRPANPAIQPCVREPDEAAVPSVGTLSAVFAGVCGAITGASSSLLLVSDNRLRLAVAVLVVATLIRMVFVRRS